MALLKGIFALILALVAAVTFSQDPQGAYSAAGCTGDEPYPQVTKDMAGTKFDCTLTIHNTDPADPTACSDENEDPICPAGTTCTDMYLFLRASKGKDTWAFASMVPNNCYGSFAPEQAKIEEFLRDKVLPGIYYPSVSPPPSVFCSVWLEDTCDPDKIPFAMKSVTQIAEDAVDTYSDPHPEWTDGMFVSIFNVTVAVQD